MADSLENGQGKEFKPVKPLDQKEHDKLKKWRAEFQQDFIVHSRWAQRKKEWENFYDGNQLSSEEIEALDQRGQPRVVINLIKPRIDGVIGDYLGSRVMMRAFDRGSGDFDKGTYITEALRYVEGQNKFDEKENGVAEDLCIGGQGWYKLSLEFDFLEPEIRINHRPNDDIVVDRRCRQRDLSDAKRLYETIWVEVEDLIELYPEHAEYIHQAAQYEPSTLQTWGEGKNVERIGDDYAKSQIATDMSGILLFDAETFVDSKRRRVRLINVWERVPKRVEFAFHPALPQQVQDVTKFSESDKAKLRTMFQGIQFVAKTRWELNSGIFICNKILEEKENVREHDSQAKFPFARAVGHFEHGEQRTPYGLVKQYVDPQKEYNKRRSKLLHKTNVAQVIADEGAVDDVQRTRKEVAKPDGWITKKPGREFAVHRDEPSQTDVYMLELAHSELERSGVSKEFVGQESKQLSGRAIALRQTEGQKMLRPFYAALRAARRDIFGLALEEMQQYWTSEKLIKITDDPLAGSITLNQRVVDPVTGEKKVINDLRLGKYDIKIDEDAETPNRRSENFANLLKLGEIAIKGGEPLPIEMIIQESEFSDKGKWLQAIAARRQQQLDQQKQLLAVQGLMRNAGAGQQNGQNAPPA